MNEKSSLVIPTIVLVKIIDKKYFYSVKRDFLSKDSVFENLELYEDFMNNPKPNLKSDTITIRKYEYEISEEVEGVDENGIYGISGGDVIDKKHKEDIELDFFIDYLIPGIEKGKKAYLLDLNKSLINADKFKDHILLDFFSTKKIEIRTVIDKATKIEEFKKNDFNAKLEENLYEILCEINSYDQIYFPIDKIHLNLRKVQVLFLFHALSKKGIIKGLSDVKLYMLVEKYFTYGKDNLPISDAYKDVGKYDFSTNQNNNLKKIGKNTFEELKTEFKTLFDFLKI
jgi:hypothetical protein